MRTLLLPLALVVLSKPAWAEPQPVRTPAAANVQQQVEGLLATAPTGTRFGLLVVDEQGREIVAINPDQRFIPASNTKMVTTAAAYALIPGMDQPDSAGGAMVALRAGKKRNAPDVVLIGRGDARLSSAADCTVDCLVTLADAVAAKTRTVVNITGDSTWFPDQRWSPGMSWNNFGSNDATAASALSLDNNELTVRVTPGEVNQPPKVDVPAYVALTNEAVTVSEGKTRLTLAHEPNSRSFRLYGTIAVGGAEWRDRIGIDDPAHYAAWTFSRLLAARGVKVTGAVTSLYRPEGPLDDPAHPLRASTRLDSAGQPAAPPLAVLTPPPLAQSVVTINKDSQNFHAEMLLRRIARVGAAGSTWDGLAAERALLERAGVPRAGYDFSDGSGMSTYNRLSPRASVALLRWIDRQPWADQWRASLPVAGRDGTLKRRFIGTALEANLAAKTGTLNATNALSGSFRTARGRRFTFAFFANDVPDGAAVVALMEAVLVRIAAAN